MARTSRFFNGLVALGLGAGLAHAQERPAAGGAPRETDANQSEYVLKTQFVEAIKAKKWKDAVETFGRLRMPPHQGVATDKRLQFMYAQALYESKEDPGYKSTVTALEGILLQQDNHIEALYLLAKVRAQATGKEDEVKAEKDKAKDHLLNSARAGQFVLRDISADKTFEFLLKEPGFILRVLNASNEYQVAAGGQHNFFVSPLVPKDNETDLDDPVIIGSTGPEDTKLKDLEERVEGLFREIERLGKDRQIEELITKFTELRQVMNEYGSSGTSEVRKKLDKWSQRMSELGEVLLSIKLQVYITEGNQHLKAMAEAIRDDLFDVALDRFNQINDLCEQMRTEEREVFRRNAEALFLRGKALADRARRLKRISEFTLKIEGVIVAPPDGKELDSAIINDRIYHEGDTLYDKESEDEIPGLRVVEIVRSTVRFRYEDTEFVRELQPQK